MVGCIPMKITPMAEVAIPDDDGHVEGWVFKPGSVNNPNKIM
jgi:hypothetical protein